MAAVRWRLVCCWHMGRIVLVADAVGREASGGLAVLPNPVTTDQHKQL